MIFNRNETNEVAVLLGAGSMGTAIIRRFAAGRKLLFGDISQKNLDRVCEEFTRSGYEAEGMIVNAMDRESIEAFAARAASLGEVKYYIHTAGASPSQGTPEHILNLDMLGTGYAIDAFGKVMAKGGAGLIISSQAGYMMPFPYETEQQILNTATEDLADLAFVKENATVSGKAYMVAKHINHLQVMKAASGAWKERRARINSISPGIIVTPLAYDEFNSPGNTYQKMIDASPAGRTASSDEIADACAFLLGEKAGFITGIDLLMDGGVISSLRTGAYQLRSQM